MNFEEPIHMNYLILAAGQGSRMAREGAVASKPMMSILGRPMIERLIDILAAMPGATRIRVVTNPAMHDLNSFLAIKQASCPVPLDFEPIVSDNSFYSLECAARGVEGRFIAMTADTIFPTDEFAAYASACGDCAGNVALMALTHYVDDESPLYAKVEGDRVTDYHYGGEPFAGAEPSVSAGIWSLTPEMLADAAAASYPESTSDFQRILALDPAVDVVPYFFSIAFDVDHVDDCAKADQFLCGRHV